jgi:hypothetical protein
MFQTCVMKSRAPWLLMILCICYFPLFAQPSGATPEAESFYITAMKQVRPAHFNWIKNTAAQANQKKMGQLAIEEETRAYGKAFQLENLDIEAMIMLLFMQIANDARDDMKEMLTEMDETRERRNKLRETQDALKQGISKSKLDSLRTYDRPPSGASNKTLPPPVSKATAFEIREVEMEFKTRADSLTALTNLLSDRIKERTTTSTKYYALASNLMKRIGNSGNNIIQKLK